MDKTIYLRKGKEESLMRFHPWIFSGAIHHTEGELEEGDVVRVLDNHGDFLALGHWQIGSIAVRVLTFRNQPIDRHFWEERFRKALGLRRAAGIAGRTDTDMYRLVHGEGDHLPGLIVDLYGSHAVMQAHSVGMHVCRLQLAEALKSVLGDSLTSIYYKSETTLPYKAPIDSSDGFI